MPEPAQDVVTALFQPLVSFSQMLTQAAPQLEQIAPHNVLAKLQQVMMAKQAPTPPPAEIQSSTPITEHQTTNTGLYRQNQTVGKRNRAGQLDEAGYMTGLGNIAQLPGRPAPSPTLSAQAYRVPTAVGLSNIVATNERGFEVEERFPVVEGKDQFTLYAPKKIAVKSPLF
jgi:hypothetical protein